MPSSWRTQLLSASIFASIVVAFFAFARSAPDDERVQARNLVAPDEESAPDAGDDFVPNLPAVPDLARDRAARAGAPVAPTPTTDDPAMASLTQEMSLVHEARQRLEHDDAQGAAALLEEHRTRFPDGALSEEREAYAILVMIRLGRAPSDVERRYTELVADHPDSAFLPLVREAIAAQVEAHGAGPAAGAPTAPR